MNIALVGATGNAGSRILAEALRRGHKVTALLRTPGKLAPLPNLTVKKSDVLKSESLSDGLAGANVIVSAYTPQRGAENYRDQVLAGYQALMAAAKAANLRLIVVGGAGSLRVPDGTYLVDSPRFPPEYRVESSSYRDVLETLKKESGLSWTYVSPSALFTPGERTGKFRIGKDQLLNDAAGQSHISMEDFAVSIVDEVENSKHVGQQFTVGY